MRARVPHLAFGEVSVDTSDVVEFSEEIVQDISVGNFI